ncbi:MAG: hypothetical protein ABSH01_01960 [Terriglobia bacterium]|jgi:hypothetical protein
MRVKSNLNRSGSIGTGDVIPRLLLFCERLLELDDLGARLAHLRLLQLDAFPVRKAPPFAAAQNFHQQEFFILVKDRL